MNKSTSLIPLNTSILITMRYHRILSSIRIMRSGWVEAVEKASWEGWTPCKNPLTVTKYGRRHHPLRCMCMWWTGRTIGAAVDFIQEHATDIRSKPVTNHTGTNNVVRESYTCIYYNPEATSETWGQPAAPSLRIQYYSPQLHTTCCRKHWPSEPGPLVAAIFPA